jgi:protein SCO1
MRYALRSSLKATDSVKNLGFRCAYDTKKPGGKSDDISSPLPASSVYALESQWTNSDGRRLSSADLAGPKRVLALIYTRCQTMCPMMTSIMLDWERNLPESLRGKVRFTLISFDTEDDGPADLKAFMAKYGLNEKNWEVLVGTKQGTRRLAELLSVVYKKGSKSAFEHTGLITVLDGNGVITGQGKPENLEVKTVLKWLERG